MSDCRAYLPGLQHGGDVVRHASHSIKSGWSRLPITLLCAWLSIGQAQTRDGVYLFEGARLITGEGTAPIEHSAFIVEQLSSGVTMT